VISFGVGVKDQCKVDVVVRIRVIVGSHILPVSPTLFISTGIFLIN